MRKSKFIKQTKVQAATAYRQGKKKEAFKLWQTADNLRQELREKKTKGAKNV